MAARIAWRAALIRLTRLQAVRAVYRYRPWSRPRRLIRYGTFAYRRHRRLRHAGRFNPRKRPARWYRDPIRPHWVVLPKNWRLRRRPFRLYNADQYPGDYHRRFRRLGRTRSSLRGYRHRRRRLARPRRGPWDWRRRRGRHPRNRRPHSVVRGTARHRRRRLAPRRVRRPSRPRGPLPPRRTRRGAHHSVLTRQRTRRLATPKRRLRRRRATPAPRRARRPPRRRVRRARQRRRLLRLTKYLGRRARPRLWWAGQRARRRGRRARPFQMPAHPNPVDPTAQLARLVGSFQRGGQSVRLDRVAKLVRRDLTQAGRPPLTVFYRLFTTLGARVVRRGGSVLRLPTVHTAHRGGAWPGRGVRAGGARAGGGGGGGAGIGAGRPPGVASPTALAARNEFTAAAVVNRAYL